MRNLTACFILGGLVLAGASAPTQAWAETRVITATTDFTWASNGQESTTDGTALIVDNLQVGDIIDVQVPAGGHGLVTVGKLTDTPVTPNPKLVLACGETGNDAAVLRETDCGATSNFNHNFTGSMKLEVLAKFSEDVNFWCTAHKGLMTGTLKLKPKA